MDIKKFLISTISIFIFVFAFDFLVHGHLLKDAYAQTAHLWRPEADCKMDFMIMSQVAFSAVLAYFFTKKHGSGASLNDGIHFGLFVGLVLAAVKIGSYAYMPIPICLTISWVIAVLAKGIGAGAVAALTSK